MQIHYRRTGRGVLLSALILAHLSLSAGEGTAVPPPEGTLLLQDFRTLSPDAPLPDGWKTSGRSESGKPVPPPLSRSPEEPGPTGI